MDDLTLERARELLFINKYELDEECIKQPSIFSHIADKCSNTSSISDCAKESLARVDAEVSKKLRLEADTKGTKISEAKLQELILLDDNHKVAFQNYADAKLNADRWYVLKESWVQRSFMLKDLCGLFYAQYFIKETVNVNPEAVEKENSEVRKKLAEYRNRNKV